jgi:hypothetical protein
MSKPASCNYGFGTWLGQAGKQCCNPLQQLQVRQQVCEIHSYCCFSCEYCRPSLLAPSRIMPENASCRLTLLTLTLKSWMDCQRQQLPAAAVGGHLQAAQTAWLLPLMACTAGACSWRVRGGITPRTSWGSHTPRYAAPSVATRQCRQLLSAPNV